MIKLIKWDCIYPNPTEISRYKYYSFDIKDGVVTVFGDGVSFEYSIEQLKEFFVPEIGSWDDLLKSEVKVNAKVETKIEEKK